MVTDSISNLIIKIKNASQAEKKSVSFPYSKVSMSIAELLKKTGYVKSVEVKGDSPVNKTLEIELLYIDGAPRVRGVERISHLSGRIYQKAKDIRGFKSGFGNVVISTPKGVMIDTEAKKQNVGGEVLFKIW